MSAACSRASLWVAIVSGASPASSSAQSSASVSRRGGGRSRSPAARPRCRSGRGEQHRRGRSAAPSFAGQALDGPVIDRPGRASPPGSRTCCSASRSGDHRRSPAGCRRRAPDRRSPRCRGPAARRTRASTAASVRENSPSSTPVRSAPAQNAGGAPVSTRHRASQSVRSQLRGEQRAASDDRPRCAVRAIERDQYHPVVPFDSHRHRSHSTLSGFAGDRVADRAAGGRGSVVTMSREPTSERARPTDPVRARRARSRSGRCSPTGSATCSFALAIAVFVIGFAIGFTGDGGARDHLDDRSAASCSPRDRPRLRRQGGRTRRPRSAASDPPDPASDLRSPVTLG